MEPSPEGGSPLCKDPVQVCSRPQSTLVSGHGFGPHIMCDLSESPSRVDLILYVRESVSMATLLMIIFP